MSKNGIDNGCGGARGGGGSNEYGGGKMGVHPFKYRHQMDNMHAIKETITFIDLL